MIMYYYVINNVEFVNYFITFHIFISMNIILIYYFVIIFTFVTFMFQIYFVLCNLLIFYLMLIHYDDGMKYFYGNLRLLIYLHLYLLLILCYYDGLYLMGILLEILLGFLILSLVLMRGMVKTYFNRLYMRY